MSSNEITPGKYKGGGRKGHTPEDYRDAILEHGTMNAAAEALDVSRTTVRDMCIRHNIYVPSIDGVPERTPSERDSS